MGQGPGCCTGDNKPQEIKLEAAAKYTPGKDKNKAFFKRQSTALNLTANVNAFYGNVVISCVGKGKCKSEFSALCLTLQQTVTKSAGYGTQDDDDDYKDKPYTQQQKKTIRSHFWAKSEKLRKYFILLLENTENDDKYVDLYNNLNDETYKVNDENADFILNQFKKIIQNDDFFLLQCLSNVTCTFGSRPLWTEINENSKDNDDLNEQTILEKVEEVHNSAFYKKLVQKGILLADNEILAIYIYTVNTEFGDLMQKNLKIPCKWKQTFYYFVRGILKIYDAVVYKQEINKLPNNLYHPIFGQGRIETPFQMLSTVNCTASEKAALDIAPADGTMYVFEDISAALAKGKLIAAPIAWIAPDPSEQEWVILPLKVLNIESSKEFGDDNCREVVIKSFVSFSAALYGVDVYGKLQNLKFVKEVLSRSII